MFEIRKFSELGAEQVLLDPPTRYRRHKPTVAFGPLNKDVRKVLDRFFSAPEVTVPEQSAFDLRDATIVRSGITMTEDAVVAETLYNLDGAKSFFGFERDGAMLTRVDTVKDRKAGDYVNLMVPTESVYGHWLFELIPKIEAAIRLGYSDRKFIISWRTPMKEQLDIILRAYGINPETQLVRGFDHPTLYERVAFMPHRNHYPYWKSPKVTEVLEDLGRRLSPKPRKRRRRLFVTREDASDRQIQNIAEIESLLAARGFEKVTSASLPFNEQVSTFQEAEIVVGVIGSALSNIVFCKRGTPIVFLSTEHMAGTWFYEICSQKGHPYSVVSGTAAAADGVATYRQNFCLKPGEVGAAIDAVEPLPAWLRWLPSRQFEATR